MSDLSRAVLAEVVRSGKRFSEVTQAHAADFKWGVEAYITGQPLSACPFPVDTLNQLSWIAGWRTAAKEDE